MEKPKDLTGLFFGKLEVIGLNKKLSDKKGRVWDCVCSCGTIVHLKTNLLNSNKKSCGKCNAVKTGNIYGKLIVLEFSEKRVVPSGYTHWWKCRCECGKIFVTTDSSLKLGRKSCGCDKIVKEKKKRRDITKREINKETYGNLTILKLSRKTKKYVFYECICTCGKTKEIRSDHLLSGNTISCGCQSESFIASGVKNYCLKFYNAVVEYKAFKNPETGYWLRYDVYIPEKNIFIEINGNQHYTMNNWHFRMSKKNGTTPEHEFEYQKKKDRMKRKFARKNGTYIEINLDKTKSLDESILFLKTRI